MQFVRVRNLDDKPLKVAYNSVTTVIPAKGEGIVEEQAAKVHFGDWDVRNTPEHAYRRDEYRRLRGLAGSIGDQPARSAIEDDDVWEQRRPKVELFTPVGERIIGVLDDPDGETLPLDESPNLQRQLEMMQAQMDEMRRQMAQEPQGILVEEDSPETATRRRGRPPTVTTSREQVAVE